MNRALRQYYETEHWRAFSKELLDEKTAMCEMCGRRRWVQGARGAWKIATRFNVHHKNYKCLNFESRSDVMVLCEECHKRIHNKAYKVIITKSGKVIF